MYRLDGLPVPHMPPQLEERLRHMFCQIQVPFLKHAPPERKNFLSYAYVLHKFMQLLEKDEYLPSFPLLKSREKLHNQDVVWRGAGVGVLQEHLTNSIPISKTE